MPQLIRTPEQIFREEEKDIYYIRFAQEEDEKDPFADASENLPGRKEIQDWLKENTPDAPVELLAPPESSGYESLL